MFDVICLIFYSSSARYSPRRSSSRLYSSYWLARPSFVCLATASKGRFLSPEGSSQKNTDVCAGFIFGSVVCFFYFRGQLRSFWTKKRWTPSRRRSTLLVAAISIGWQFSSRTSSGSCRHTVFRLQCQLVPLPLEENLLGRSFEKKKSRKMTASTRPRNYTAEWMKTGWYIREDVKKSKTPSSLGKTEEFFCK